MSSGVRPDNPKANAIEWRAFGISVRLLRRSGRMPPHAVLSHQFGGDGVQRVGAGAPVDLGPDAVEPRATHAAAEMLVLQKQQKPLRDFFGAFRIDQEA